MRKLRSPLLGVCLLFLGLADWGASAQELFTDKSDAAPVEVDRIYVKGLQYLVRTQGADGSWTDTSYGKEPAVVGLSVISMLAHGDDPNSGPFSQSIQRGLSYILEQKNKTGYIGRSMYNHGFGTLALAEAYGAVDDARLGPALQQAVRVILTSQANNPLGAWRYSPESTDADTTVSGAQMVALFAARNAGIAVPEEAIQKALKFFASCQTPEGGYGYTSASSPNGARTAIGCLVLALAKEKNSKAFRAAFDFLQKAPADVSYQQYFLYYASQAFFHASPQAWQGWNRRNIKALAASQNPDGSWEGQFGQTFSTAASLLSLALNYRYLPIYER
jgi:squalene cyclase